MLKNFESLSVMPEKTEIEWENGNVGDLVSRMPPFNHGHVLRLSNGAYLRTYYNNPDYTALLQEKFEIFPVNHDVDIIGELYFHQDALPMAKGHIDSAQRKSFVRAKSFGIFKSVISSVASRYMGIYEDGILPIHGAALANHQVGNILFLGGHGAGKTTSLLNIANELRSGTISSDDWLASSVTGENLNVTPMDCSVSISGEFLRLNEHLTFPNVPNIDNLASVRKMSFSPEKLLGPNFRGGEIDTITKVVLLTRHTSGLMDQVLDPAGLERIFTSTAYHYPYDEHLRQSHQATWAERLRSLDLNYYVFNQLNASSIKDGYRIMVDRLMK